MHFTFSENTLLRWVNDLGASIYAKDLITNDFTPKYRFMMSLTSYSYEVLSSRTQLRGPDKRGISYSTIGFGRIFLHPSGFIVYFSYTTSGSTQHNTVLCAWSNYTTKKIWKTTSPWTSPAKSKATFNRNEYNLLGGGILGWWRVWRLSPEPTKLASSKINDDSPRPVDSVPATLKEKTINLHIFSYMHKFSHIINKSIIIAHLSKTFSSKARLNEGWLSLNLKAFQQKLG